MKIISRPTINQGIKDIIEQASRKYGCGLYHEKLVQILIGMAAKIVNSEPETSKLLISYSLRLSIYSKYLRRINASSET